MSLVECHTGQEVLDNYRAVRDRMNKLKATPQPPTPQLVPQPEQKSVDFYQEQIAELKRQLSDVQRCMSTVMHMLELDAESLSHVPSYIRISDIKKVVCEYFGVTEHDLDSQVRTARILHARQIAMFLSRQHTVQSYPVIGKLFGHRDHTTALNAVQRITVAKIKKEVVAAELAELDRQISDLKRQRTALG
jgi:chromosomal replication initiation ATPase DnaA